MAETPVSLSLESPVGDLRLVATDEALLRVEFTGHHTNIGRPGKNAILQTACDQLREYFAGQRQAFSLPVAPQGTDFQRQVWAALQAIPFGSTRSYAEIAHAIGKPRAVRAVGAANARNPLPLVVPCHRVIGSNGRLTGFAGGLATKQFLLTLEGVTANVTH
ncbi:MAG: methylated-DNA--[protein]-cysteine S-methyltransferase [Halieaceae bacterium]|jgi:methylated-DNA-[protein]-cysteine S-methyltransferase|nr:methylated-DNA--[protein]-cysteine S-methyltransferase [Halieaceae bacterium]